jgi:hypothetical protein
MGSVRTPAFVFGAVEAARCQVDVFPPERAEFPEAEASVESSGPQRSIADVRERLEHLRDLCGVEHAVSRLDHAGRELEAGARVRTDPPTLHGPAHDDAQRVERAPHRVRRQTARTEAVSVVEEVDVRDLVHAERAEIVKDVRS